MNDEPQIPDLTVTQGDVDGWIALGKLIVKGAVLILAVCGAALFAVIAAAHIAGAR